MIDAAMAILYTIKDLSAVISLLLIMRFVFSEKLRLDRIRQIVFIVIIVLNSITGFFLLKSRTADYDSIMDFVSNLIYIFALIFMTEKTGKGRIILTVFVYIYTADMLYALISSYTGANLTVEYTVNIITFTAACLAIYFICIKSQINILPGVFAGIPLWVYILLLFFELTCYYKEFGASAAWYKTMYFVSVAGIVVCLFYMLFKISLMAYRQNEIINRMELMKEDFEQKNRGDEELRRFRHDYKNHMIVISALLSDGKTDEAAEYTQKLGEQVSESSRIIRTGNSAADAVMNHKNAAATAKNIEIRYTGYIPTRCIEDIDICAVLSNLLDNAIEATDKCHSGRTIQIEANLVNDNFLLTVSNPYKTVSKDKEGNLKTTKKDSINHGIGMKNVARIVEKYHGAMFTEQEYSVFTTNVRMKINKMKI